MFAKAQTNRHRKQIRHYHQPGDCHKLTFSCYRRMSLLTNNTWRRMLSESIDDAMDANSFRLAAFVYMPEHVHLLVYPTVSQPDIDRLLAAIKRPVSRQVKEMLLQTGSRLLPKLTVRERPGKMAFRFWQEGPGYDRNLSTPQAVLVSMQYIHMNPVRRGLCQQAHQWKWSSCRHYLFPEEEPDPDLPTVHGLPAEYLT